MQEDDKTHIMFTANLAGSSSSHLRPYDTKRDSHSSHSRLNLHELDQVTEVEEAKKRLYENNVEVRNSQDANYERLEVDPEKFQAVLNERRRERFMKDYKTWLYLGLCSLIIIGAVVLIILAGMGRLKR